MSLLAAALPDGLFFSERACLFPFSPFCAPVCYYCVSQFSGACQAARAMMTILSLLLLSTLSFTCPACLLVG